MGDRVESFAQRIRSAAKDLGGSGAVMSVDDIMEKAVIQTHQDKKRAWNALRDLCRAGELERVDRGQYRCRLRRDGAPEKQTVMWRFLKMRRVVTVDDLVAASGSSAEYSREWLRGLVRKDVVKKREDGAYVLLQDLPVSEPPKDDAKAEKLRELRRRQKARVVEALEQIYASTLGLCNGMAVLVEAVRKFGEEESC